MATPTQVTSASEWRRPRGEELKLPSGNVCLIIRPGMEKLFTAGVLPDELTKIAMQSIDAAKKGPQDHKPKQGEEEVDPELMQKFFSEQGAIQDIFMAFDRVTEMCVIQPPVKWHMRKVLTSQGDHARTVDGKPEYEEIPLSEREEEFLYTDEVDSDDKMFIFNYVVGGTRDLETFHSEYGDALATLQPREDVEMPPESTGRHSL